MNCSGRLPAKGGQLAHLVQPVGLIDISVLGVLNLLWCIPHKVVSLRSTEVLQLSSAQLPQQVKDLHHDPVGIMDDLLQDVVTPVRAAIRAPQLLSTLCRLSGLMKRS